MPARACLTGALVFLLAFASALSLRAYDSPTTKAPHPLTYPDDTFAFKNETVWNYEGGSIEPVKDKDHVRDYTRRCFTMCRSIVQFWKFARFDPTQPPLPPAEFAHRVREISERSVWLPAFSERDRIVIPGYRNLHEASEKMRYVFQANIGRGWPIYFRAGNMPISFWVTRALEDRLNGEIWHDLQLNTPTILWVYRFPSLKMNHVVIVFSGTRSAEGRYHYHVYDPNYRDRYSNFDYDPKSRTFTFQKVYFFKGGPVTVRSIYRGWLQ